MLNADTTFSWYEHPESEYTFYSTKENFLIYCVDVKDLIEKLGTAYYLTDWRLFINASKTSLKTVLLHNDNQFACIPLAHLTSIKEFYEDIEVLRSKLQYATHARIIVLILKF